jgi:hypothetical protein
MGTAQLKRETVQNCHQMGGQGELATSVFMVQAPTVDLKLDKPN